MRRLNSLPSRMLGVVRAPRATFEGLADDPRWIDVLLVTFAITALSSALLFETDTGRLALLDRWERTALAWGPVDDARYAALIRASDHGAMYAVASAFVFGPALVGVLAAVLFGVFRLAGSRVVPFRLVLAVVSHATVILMLRQVIAAPLSFAREALTGPGTLGLLVTVPDEGSALARFLGIVDLFVIWWTAVLAVGMSVVYRKPARRLALAFMGTYVVLAAVLTITMALTGGTA